MLRTRGASVVIVPVVLVLAVFARAGEPPPSPADPAAVKAAQQDLAALHATSQATLAAELQEAFAALVAGLKAFDASLAGERPDPTELAALLRTFQADVHGALATMTTSTVSGTFSILNAFADGMPLGGQYPPGFTHGDGSAIDRLDTRIVKRLDKLYRKAGKRLAATVRKAEKHGLLLNVLLEKPAGGKTSGLANETNSTFYTQQLTIDLAVASRFAGEPTGTVEVGGTLGVTGTLSVSIGSILLDLQPVTTSGARWSQVREESPGNFLVLARQGTGGDVVDKIGLR